MNRPGDAPPFELGPIRPVAEARSLLIRTTRGCPWNRCDFCVNYQDMAFSIRSVADIERDIEMAADYYQGHAFAGCFLQDGDSLLMPTEDLVRVLATLRRHFPSLERITSYGRAATMARKTPDEMAAIAAAGLNRLYCGMESGSDEVLRRIHKGTTAAQIVRAGQLARQAGIEVSEFIIIGIGGRELSREHALATARALVQIDPEFIRVRAIGVKQGSRLEQSRQRGDWVLPTEDELIREQRLLLEHLDGVGGYFSNDHAVNLLMEVEGQLPAAKDDLLAKLDRFLALPDEERVRFALGRRLGHYQTLDDRDQIGRREAVARQVEQLRRQYPGMEDEVCHALRERVV